MPPKKKIKMQAASTKNGLPEISFATSKVRGDEKRHDREITLSLGYGRIGAIVRGYEQSI